jgi:primosomal protein N' (replication factor Y)
MTWHKSKGRMVCHYCGHQTRPHSVCPECGSLDVGYIGFGTERIEEDLVRAVPQLTVARLDTDVTAKRGALRLILDAFAAGEIDVLLGTQMVAKGLNFPGVRTVGIVMADTGLAMPDFRAAERTFSLIVQVAGRAGRFRRDGEVIVQTIRPEHDAIRDAVSMRVNEFYERELAVRRELAYPPFSRLLRLVIRSRDRRAAEAVAEQIALRLRDGAYQQRPGAAPVSVLGPAPAPLERLNNSWRQQLILKGERPGDLVQAARAALQAMPRSQHVYVEVDVDPVNLM